MDYTEPKIVDHGDLSELTAQQQDGNFLDKDFPVNTPKEDLTFS